jgi:hypothetical protein
VETILIDRKLILANAPSNIGDQVHINHTGCEAGEDKKRRLYIKRTERGLVAYCHHCNESGSAKDNNSGRMSSWLGKKTTVATTVAAKPILAALPTAGKMWLMTNYCSSSTEYFNGVAAEGMKVALTLHNPESEVIGWQIRNLERGATPKYLTHYIKNSVRGDASWFHKDNKALVITEDYLSAYRVHKDTGLSSVALLRTTMSDKTLLQVYDLEFKDIFIWLDPDDAGVKGTTDVYRKLTHFLPTTTNIAMLGINKEPKECEPADLCHILL